MKRKNSFLSNMTKNDVVGENGMPAHSTSDSAVLDLFFLLGTRPSGKRLLNAVDAAWADNPTLTLKCLFQARDVRSGKGERDSFREAIKHLANKLPSNLVKLIPEYGRWDDLQTLVGTPLETAVFEAVSSGLEGKNGLCAKWTPRKGDFAVALTKFLGLSPKRYRKLLVGLTNVVETDMCERKWTDIDYSKVPSQAGKIYAKAFNRHNPEGYSSWRTKLSEPNSGVKINVSTLYPHEVTAKLWDTSYPVEEAWAKLQETFPEVEDRILPVCDVSGSMHGLPMDVCIALGLFLSQRNRGPFQDCFVTFSESPKLQKLSGNLKSRFSQLQRAEWAMNTNLEAVFELVAKAASKSAPEDVPSTILIMSDMQFDACVRNSSQNAFKMAKKLFDERGLKLPNVVFWNLRDSGSNTLPVKADKSGAALISGYSPSILKNLLGNPSEISPMGIMLKTLEAERYAPIKL
jgi:hypothetical protein